VGGWGWHTENMQNEAQKLNLEIEALYLERRSREVELEALEYSIVCELTEPRDITRAANSIDEIDATIQEISDSMEDLQAKLGRAQGNY
jgi:predicted RNase H-like nuclease (RuvC/YqgF family)